MSDIRCHRKMHVEPITQIVGGVGLLLAGVLNLLGNLLSGLGLDSLFRGILGATVRIHQQHSG